MENRRTDFIPADTAGTLAGLFRERVERSPQAVAYRQYDAESAVWSDATWGDMASAVARWHAAFAGEGLQPGDRVALMLRNCREWVAFDQGALRAGLVTVPLYVEDHPENVAHILADSGAALLLLDSRKKWERLSAACRSNTALRRIVVLDHEPADTDDNRLVSAASWLPAEARPLPYVDRTPQDLATIVYTSGTTGRSKGVMLSHANVLSNAQSVLRCIPAYADDLFLSFLPLSHTLERTVGYYLPVMAGATVAFARSIQVLGEDLTAVRPTVLISVPRIYERVYRRIMSGLDSKGVLARSLFQLAAEVGWRRFERLQGRERWSPMQILWPVLRLLVARKILERLGGRLRVAVCGGAPLPPLVGKIFLGLGLPVLHGYGLTEASPVVSANRLEDNLPASVGPPIPEVKVRINDNDELLAKGANVMLGYWNNPVATRELVDDDGWLHTGDQVRLDASGRIYITGRLKEIIVLSNGEKVSPGDMELALSANPLFDQIMIVGEGRPYLSALVVPNPDRWRESGLEFTSGNALDRKTERSLLRSIREQLHGFPGYARVRRVAVTMDPWTIENGLLTPTLKVRRSKVLEFHAADVEHLYEGYETIEE